MKFGKVLKELREERQLTHKELARITNISQSNISFWERDMHQPTAEAIITLAQYFNVTTDYLLGLEDDGGTKISVRGDYNNVGNNNKITNNTDTEKLKEIRNMIDELLKKSESITWGN